MDKLLPATASELGPGLLKADTFWAQGKESIAYSRAQWREGVVWMQEAVERPKDD